MIGYPGEFKPINEFNNQINQSKSFVVNYSSVNYGNTSYDSSESIGGSDVRYLTSEQYNKFLHLINKNCVNDDVSTAANMAGSSLFQFCNSSISSKSPRSWIVDSGATQHMIAFESQLSDTVDVSRLKLLVKHPNGSFAWINKIGNLQFSSHLTLYVVFDVRVFQCQPFVCT